MTTAEMIDFRGEHGLVGDTHSVYRGPCRDRLSLRAAHAAGVLLFSVNRSDIGLKIGEPTVHGYYETFEAAVAALRTVGKGWRLSAHARGWGYTEECLIYCSYWKPLGDLLVAA